MNGKEEAYDGAIKMLCGFNEKSEVSKYRTLFGSRCNIKLLNAKGKEKTTGYMATGDVYALYDSKGNIVDKLIVIVNGDMNGDGKVNSADYIAQRDIFSALSDLTLRTSPLPMSTATEKFRQTTVLNSESSSLDS